MPTKTNVQYNEMSGIERLQHVQWPAVVVLRTGARKEKSGYVMLVAVMFLSKVICRFHLCLWYDNTEANISKPSAFGFFFYFFY